MLLLAAARRHALHCARTGLAAACALLLAAPAALAEAPSGDRAAAKAAPVAAGATPTAPPGTPPLLARHRLRYDSMAGARLNPLGLQEKLNLSYRYRLYDDPGALWREAHLGANVSVQLTPAVAVVGVNVSFAPLSILTLTAGYNFVGWFGTIDSIQSYRSADAAHSDSDLAAGTEAGRRYGAVGHELELSAQALAKVGPVVLLNTLLVLRSDLELHAGDRLYYDIRTDMMVPDGGFALVNDTDLVVLTDWGLVAGARLTVSHAAYRPGDYAAGTVRDNGNTPTLRAGPLMAYVLAEEALGLTKPTLLVVAGWWLRHRYRTGVDVSQAMPLVVIGFRFEGEFLQSGAPAPGG